MQAFIFYFRQGIQHITDVKGLDHMVFITTLCAIYDLRQWRNLMILITAFTIGHSVSLALSSLNIISINQKLVETLIPVTIFLTSIFNITHQSDQLKKVNYNYLLALGFGFIHGMGFSNFFRAMMMGISDQSIVFPLFSFNLGIEAGQLIIVSIFLTVLFLIKRLSTMKQEQWKIYISGAGGGIAVSMIVKILL